MRENKTKLTSQTRLSASLRFVALKKGVLKNTGETLPINIPRKRKDKKLLSYMALYVDNEVKMHETTA